MKFLTTNQWDETLWKRVREIYQEAFGEHRGKPEKVIRNMFARNPCFLHVLLEENTVLAMALTGSIKNSRTLLIDYLAVQNDIRKKGLGKELLDYIKQWVLSGQFYDRILLEVECEKTEENLARIQFWEKCGFTLVEDYIHHYIWVPEPYMAMQLVLHHYNHHYYQCKGEELFKIIVTFHKESFRIKKSK